MITLSETEKDICSYDIFILYVCICIYIYMHIYMYIMYTAYIHIIYIIFTTGYPQTMYGPNYELKCTCKNDRLCNPVDGRCTWGLGWTGNYCEKGKLISAFFYSIKIQSIQLLVDKI